MDVCLVLSHRCNLACTYCYAGDHHKTDMDDATLDRAVDLLYSDAAGAAELSFFGGEPFLAFPAMQRAVARAQAAAAARGRRLTVQCTTNGAALRPEHIEFVRQTGMRTTVSIDGVKEAHDLQRPSAGGGSSWPRVVAGLRGLREAGCRPDAMMVISPETVPYVYRSVSWLWAEGIATVRANLVLDAPWSAADRADLREQSFAVASELVARRGRGEVAGFEPMAPAIRRALEPAGKRRTVAPAPGQIVVAPSGHLYPCAPMVGEDRASGREAALRLGHLDQGPAAIARQITCAGAGCDDGKGCACAAYLETGDRHLAGPNGLWWAALCDELGTEAGRAIARQPRLLAPIAQKRSRRPFIVGLAAALGGLSLGIPALLGMQPSHPGGDGAAPPGGTCRMPPVEVEFAQPPPDEPTPAPPGQMMAPPALLPDPPGTVDGEMKAPPPPEPRPKGDIAAPAEPASHKTRGMLRAPISTDD